MNARWPLNESFRLRLTMLSDWHIGSGTGRPGNVDRLIVRDSDGLPFAPAKTLRAAGARVG
jgi:CRISPR-associated protein Csx10